VEHNVPEGPDFAGFLPTLGAGEGVRLRDDITRIPRERFHASRPRITCASQEVSLRIRHPQRALRGKKLTTATKNAIAVLTCSLVRRDPAPMWGLILTGYIHFAAAAG